MSCIILGDSSFRHVTTLNILVTIGILIVSGKILHQKCGSYKYVLPLKVELTGQPLGKKNILQPQKYILWEEVHFGEPFSLPSLTLLLKWKPVELKSTLSTVWKLETLIMLLCIFGVFILK